MPKHEDILIRDNVVSAVKTILKISFINAFIFYKQIYKPTSKQMCPFYNTSISIISKGF